MVVIEFFLTLCEGDSISVFYDPMIAKVIAFGKNRTEAIYRLSQALEEMRIVGVRTNIPLLLNILKNREFRVGPVDTSFIQEQSADLFNISKPSVEDLAILAGYFQVSALLNMEVGTSTPF